MQNQDFRKVGNAVRIGAAILTKAQQVLNAERLMYNHRPNAQKKAAWPAMLLELEGSSASGEGSGALTYTAKDVTESWQIFETFAKLPYDNADKKMVLRYCRGQYDNRSWAKANPAFHWAVNRRIGEQILVHLVQVLGQAI